ncbi:MAG: hypothetical protein QM733_12385 [Ilumatobacteraceae bacterium]
MVQVVDEVVDRPQPLLQATLDGPPLARRDDPRDDVERPGTVDAPPVGVDGERDPEGEDVDLGEVLAGLQLDQPHPLQVIRQRLRGRTRLTVAADQLVPGARRRPQLRHRHRATLVTGCFPPMAR